jgi:hypothetical protein
MPLNKCKDLIPCALHRSIATACSATPGGLFLWIAYQFAKLPLFQALFMLADIKPGVNMVAAATACILQCSCSMVFNMNCMLRHHGMMLAMQTSA